VKKTVFVAGLVVLFVSCRSRTTPEVLVVKALPEKRQPLIDACSLKILNQGLQRAVVSHGTAADFPQLDYRENATPLWNLISKANGGLFSVFISMITADGDRSSVYGYDFAVKQSGKECEITGVSIVPKRNLSQKKYQTQDRRFLMFKDRCAVAAINLALNEGYTRYRLKSHLIGFIDHESTFVRTTQPEAAWTYYLKVGFDIGDQWEMYKTTIQGVPKTHRCDRQAILDWEKLVVL